jgi:hypothetical protein
VLWVGFVVHSALVFLPLVHRHLPPEAMGDFIAAYRDRASFVVWTDIGLFAVTGVSLFLFNKNYNGDLWDVTANPWTIFLTIKHIVVVGWVPLALYMVNILMPKLAEVLLTGAPEAEKLLRRCNRLSILAAWLGVLVITLIATAKTAGT